LSVGEEFRAARDCLPSALLLARPPLQGEQLRRPELHAGLRRSRRGFEELPVTVYELEVDGCHLTEEARTAGVVEFAPVGEDVLLSVGSGPVAQLLFS
jgi:hypothetical protein